MGMSTGSSGGPQGDINVTPLVDIVLVLLIIFMVITPLLSKNIEIEVPQKVEDPEPPEEKMKDQMVLKLFADGHVELNKNVVEVADLADQLKDVYNGRADKVLFFEGEDDAPYGPAVTLMDLAKGAGVVTIGIMTPNEDADPALDGIPLDGVPADGAPAAPVEGG